MAAARGGLTGLFLGLALYGLISPRDGLFMLLWVFLHRVIFQAVAGLLRGQIIQFSRSSVNRP